MSAAQARKDLIEALHRLAGASVETTERRFSEALEAADLFAVALGRSAETTIYPCCGHCEHDESEIAPDRHTVPCAEGCNRGEDCGHDAVVAQLAEIRIVLEAFDWETDDRQYALEQIDDIVNRSESHG